MTILNYSDDTNYVVVRKGIEFYYFGLGCIADYYGDSIAYLDESALQIMLLCYGKHTILEIIQDVACVIKKDNKEIESIVKKMFKKGILVFQSQPIKKELIFHGTKGSYYPKEIAIELTNSCNYKCPFCYKSAKDNGQYISDEDILKLDSSIHNNVNNILLTGGEPTLHPNYLKYIELFSKYANVHMISNGSTLYNHDPSILQKLTVIQFSIYGCNNLEYKKMTGNVDGFTRLCKSIDFTKKNGIYTKGAITLCDSTVDHIESFIETAVNLGLDSLRIGVADIFGRGKYLYEGSSNFVKQREEALDLIIELKRKYRNKINIELPNINTRHVGDHNDMHTCVYRGSLQCGCGSEYLVVSHTGEIRPCQMLPESWFSIKNKNALSEHIGGDFHIKQLREAANKYYIDNNINIIGVSPCEALESLINSEELRDV